MIRTAIKVSIPTFYTAYIDVDAAKNLVDDLNKQIADSWEERALEKSIDSDLPIVKYRKIPIVISKYDDNENKGWKAEIPDNYEVFKPACYDDLNFEDLLFHFGFPTETHPNDDYLFKKQKDAVEAAKYVNENYLNGKAKVWFLKN